MTRLPLIQPLSDCRDVTLAGAKAVNLGELLRAGLPVPDGFVLTTEAFRQYRSTRTDSSSFAAVGPRIGLDVASSDGEHADPEVQTDGRSTWPDGDSACEGKDDLSFAAEVLGAYRALGSPAVAVRSSATIEDDAGSSLAGQYETFLDIRDETSLLEAVVRCFASLNSPRVRAYLSERGRDPASASMAVIIQRLVPAEVAGVMFCADPRTGSRREMLIEASWGLGEAIVAGKVQPDVIRLDAETGRVSEAKIAHKRVCIRPGAGEQEVSETQKDQRCLRPNHVARLWDLARTVCRHFSAPQDIEFAVHEGQIYLLQSRPITTLEDAEAFDELLQSVKSHLRDRVNEGGGPWVLHNLAETLPHATSLTWSVMQRFMSASGGFGGLYRLAGFEPCASLKDKGFIDRIGGKPYMDLSFAPRMFFPQFPFKYDLEEIQSNPDAAQSPPTLPAGKLIQRMAVHTKIAKANRRLRQLADTFDSQLQPPGPKVGKGASGSGSVARADKGGGIVADFVQWCRSQEKIDLSSLGAEELLDLWHEREHRVLDQFAPQSLLPSLITSMYLTELKALLSESFWDEDIDRLASTLASACAEPDQTVLMNAGLHDLAHGRITTGAWMQRFGHRTPAEIDLATPRWRERPDGLVRYAAQLEGSPHPLVVHRSHVQGAQRELDQVLARLSRSEARRLRSVVANLHRYLRWREDGKHFLMVGYELLRGLALEMGRRLEIGDDVFHLTLEELTDALRLGYPPYPLLAERKRLYRAESRLSLPRVITREDIALLGTAYPRTDAVHATLAAFPLSSGRATGPVRILHSPDTSAPFEKGYILVCPSTDPGWTPCFINAAGLIIETGGTLSHGAIVARELNLPAVVLPNATTLLADGETLTLDADTGCVLRTAHPPPHGASDGNEQKAKPKILIPPPGRRERFSHTLRDITLIFWSAYLLAAWILPDHWLYRPSLSVLDVFLWPLVRAMGKPAAVAVIAIATAGLVMLAQLLLTDNFRLREAKRRAGMLERAAPEFPRGDPRRARMHDAAHSARYRATLAGLVPLAVLLGPMTMLFFWFPARVDPAVWNVPAGSSVTLTATIDGVAPRAVHLVAPPPLELDRTPVQTTEPIRATLESLAHELATPSNVAHLPWELQELSQQTRQKMLADLRSFLADGVPPQTVAWRVQTPPGRSERFIVSVATDQARPLQIPIVVGDNHPPGPREVIADPTSPLHSIKVNYPPPPRRPLFWQPLAPFVDRSSSLHYWEAGWLTVYLLAYVPAMFLFRWMLRIA